MKSFRMSLPRPPEYEVAADHPLASAWSKYHRALEHFESLRDEAALEAANRSLTIAHAFAESQRSGTPLPAAVVDAYLSSVDREQAQLAALREKVQLFKSWFRTH